MRKILYFISFVMILVVTTTNVYAECTTEEINSLKKEAEKIKVTYKHLGAVEDEELGTVYDRFNVTFKDVNSDLYIELFDFSYTKYPEEGVITDTFTTGNWNFGIYSDKCEDRIHEINVYLPRFNMYSLDPLCEGIDGKDFALCGKYYEYDVSYESFKQRVENYRRTHKVEITSEKEEKEDRDFSYYWNYIYNFVYENIVYFAIGLGVFLILLVIFIIIKKRKSRGVLK